MFVINVMMMLRFEIIFRVMADIDIDAIAIVSSLISPEA